ncbi:hypothetical protein BGY98DRAFT_936650 [Russula aff. rugulosa BPL654]|nr:hypothetical protein BGY98DRAFT_936650 [Russula aff. rugulosa BPL654]
MTAHESNLSFVAAVFDEPNTLDRDDAILNNNRNDAEGSSIEILNDGNNTDIYKESKLVKFSRMLGNTQKKAREKENCKSFKENAASVSQPQNNQSCISKNTDIKELAYAASKGPALIEKCYSITTLNLYPTKKNVNGVENCPMMQQLAVCFVNVFSAKDGDIGKKTATTYISIALSKKFVKFQWTKPTISEYSYSVD